MKSEGYADTKLHDLVDTKNPNAVFGESLHIGSLIHPGFDGSFLEQVFLDVVRLFRGDYPGYRHSTTLYHDLQHTAEVLLCTMRLLHGAIVSGTLNNGKLPSPRMTELSMIAALLHDVGLIQDEKDNAGTGAKYTVGHEKRSVDFLKKYMLKAGRSQKDIYDASRMIDCTCLGVQAHEIEYRDKSSEFAAQVIATADLLAQMGDREYLEKLLLLYLEFEEAGLPYESPYDLLEKTHGFYDLMVQRMDGPLDGVRRFSRQHFQSRWDIDKDLYDCSIQANMRYLYVVLKESPQSYLGKLKRGGIVRDIIQS